MKSRPRSPLVVVDWNFIQTAAAADLQPGRLQAPPNWDFVIPESASHEVLDKSASDRVRAETYLRKLVTFFRDHRARTWLGKPTGGVCDLPPREMRLRDLVEITATARVREKIGRDAHDFAQLMTEGLGYEGHKKFRKCEDAFVSMCAEARAFLRQHAPDYNPQKLSDAEITTWIRDPASAQQWVPRDWATQAGVTDAQLARFPDIVPFARWMRVVVSYALHRYKTDPDTKRDKAFSNCFADADAAFLASYTGHLLTNDRGQQQAAMAIRPDVRIWTWNQQVRRLAPMGAD